ncbi:MAG TPA: carboxypeptidase-like regulatory domain-containing protein, partial [Acidobacteriota bacterium]|nr:carboxypeptidase-like regulatory domain-containing protein [Acidobacteriota bacterium]
MRRIFVLAIIFICSRGIGVYAQVQTTTAINGTVRDTSGAAIPGVTITIRDQATGAVRETVTDESGYYSVLSLRPSTYTITASLPGFKTAVVT